MTLCSLQRGALARSSSSQLRQAQGVHRRPIGAPVGSRRAAGWRAGASSGGRSGGGISGGGGGDLLDGRLAGALLKDPVSFLGGVFAGFLALNLQQGKREGRRRPPHKISTLLSLSAHGASAPLAHPPPCPLPCPAACMQSRCGRGSTRPLQRQGSSTKPP